MFFSSIKEMNGLLTEINRLSKGMSNIYLKVTIEKKWRTQKFDFQSLKNSSPGQFWGTFNSRRYRIFWEQKMLLNKNTNSNQNETESKMENPTHSFREMNPSASACRRIANYK